MTTVRNGQSSEIDHLDLVDQEVRRLIRRVPPHVERDELVAVGMLALVASARRHADLEGEVFARIARKRVRGALLDEMRRADWAPRAVRRRVRDVEAAQAELADRLGRKPSTGEVGQALGVAAREVESALVEADKSRPVSLDGMAPAAVDTLVAARSQSPEEVLLRRELVGYLRAAVGVLPPRQRRVVFDTVVHQRPLAETAAVLGVSESRVSQLRTEVLGLLRDGINAQIDPDLVSWRHSRRGRAVAVREEFCAKVARAARAPGPWSARPARPRSPVPDAA